MLVREVMSNGSITVPVGTTIKTALDRLASAGITSLPVVNSSGNLRGIVSEADLIREGVRADLHMREITQPVVMLDRGCVDDVMTRHVLTVGPDTDLAEAVELLTSTAVKSLPVIDRRGRVLGVVSRSDVIRMLARSDHDLEGDVGAALVNVGLGDWLVEVSDGVVDLLPPSPAGDDRALARVAAGNVPGVVEVRLPSSD